MRIQELTLKNFRGFEDLTVTFPEGEGGLAVFVGLNGSGKTSVLEAIAHLLNDFVGDLSDSKDSNIRKEGNAILIGSKDVKNNTTGGKIVLRFKFLEENIINFWNIQTEGGKSRLTGEHREHLFQLLKTRLLNSAWLQAPIISYFSTDRFVAKPELKVVDLKNYRSFNVYDEQAGSFTNFSDFFNWFRSMEDLENQKRLNEEATYKEPALEAVRIAIEKFLSFEKPRVERAFPERLVIEKKGEPFSFQQLSHGERLMIALLGDIARKLSYSNDNPLEGKGVVLIDEIELHLHPDWQRKIIPLLCQIFPKVQFIVTTHSPQVISTVKKENVFILEDFKLVEKTPFTAGHDANSILYNIFGIEERPKFAQDDLTKLFRLMEDEEKNVEKIQKALNDLEKKYGKNEPELIRAKTHFEFLFH